MKKIIEVNESNFSLVDPLIMEGFSKGDCTNLFREARRDFLDFKMLT